MVASTKAAAGMRVALALALVGGLLASPSFVSLADAARDLPPEAEAMITAALGNASTALDDYINKPESVYKWEFNGVSYPTIFGNTAYFLNVTSLTWLTKDRAGVIVVDASKDGKTPPKLSNVWTHLVCVIVPPGDKMFSRKTAFAYLTSGRNDGTPLSYPPNNEDVLIVDRIVSWSGVVGLTVFQIPNQPMLYPSDPQQVHRTEDPMIAWAWNEYLNMPDGARDPTWLPRLPMTKAAFQVMRGAQEFLQEQNFAEIDGWFVAGASKRGWTTWTVGMATCHQPWCVNIVGIAPIVPVVPDVKELIHWMWRAYGGFTFAFQDYTRVNLTERVDTPAMQELQHTVDPKYFLPQLSRYPKFIMISSDDEFMMMDWSEMWYDEMKAGGETHLLIVANAEHTMITGLVPALSSMSAAIRSIAAGHGPDQRPQFDYARDPTDGTLQVTVPEGAVQPERVVLRFAETLQDVRRDFRWVRQANNRTQPCDPPFIPLPSTVFGGNCVQPIIWAGEDLPPEKPGTWRVKPPQPREGFWMGYYIELYFPSDTDSEKNLFRTTTPGFVWPDTFPFEDCHGAECIGQLV